MKVFKTFAIHRHTQSQKRVSCPVDSFTTTLPRQITAMSSSSLAAIKAATQSRTLEGQHTNERQRDLLLLILSHLQTNGYISTATTLLSESHSVAPLSRYDVAENIDLLQVLKEYEEYYAMKFGRRLIVSRPAQHHTPTNVGHGNQMLGESDDAPNRRNTRNKRRSRSNHQDSQQQQKQQRRTSALPPLSTKHNAPTSSTVSRKIAFHEEGKEEEKCSSSDGMNVDQGVKGFGLSSPSKSRKQPTPLPNTKHTDGNDAESRQTWKPLPHFDDLELRSLALSIRRDIIQESPGVGWNDIVDLNDVKRLLKEAIILPKKYPQLFTGLRAPWKSVLLHGTPGTGKTLLAKAVATESNAVFFNISASSIVSKFRGDSEKLIRMLFDLARHYAPSTIFFDEIDALMSHRGGMNGGSASGNEEHESSRRIKTELLVQMDGLLANNTDVFVLAASNLPWDLDTAFLRRMEKRVMIPMPTKEGRKEMIKSHLSDFSPSLFKKDELLNRCAEQTEGYSGSDIKNLCKEMSMRPLRRMLTQLEQTPTTWSEQNLSLLVKRNPITEQDFVQSLSTINQSTDAELCARHTKWSESHGAQ